MTRRKTGAVALVFALGCGPTPRAQPPTPSPRQANAEPSPRSASPQPRPSYRPPSRSHSVELDSHNSCAVDSQGVPHCWSSSSDFYRFEIGAEVRALALGGRAAGVLDTAGEVHILQSRDLARYSGPTPVHALMFAPYFGCAVAGPDGAVVCWGSNSAGQLGNATWEATNKTVDTGLRRGMQVVSDRDSACARLDDGTVWCWGGNKAEGDDRRARPERVPGLDDVAELASCEQCRYCARRELGTVVCWQLEDVGYASFGPVMAIEGLVDSIDIAVTTDETCAADSRGVVRCVDTWPPAPPRAIAGLEDVVEIDGGGDGLCARERDGALKCWGKRVYRGPDNPGSIARPVRVQDLEDVVEVATGSNLGCARERDGGTACWGGGFKLRASIDSDVPRSDWTTQPVETGRPPAREISASYDVCTVDAAGIRCGREQTLIPDTKGARRLAGDGYDGLCWRERRGFRCVGANLGFVDPKECRRYTDDEPYRPAGVPNKASQLVVGASGGCWVAGGRASCWRGGLPGSYPPLVDGCPDTARVFDVPTASPVASVAIGGQRVCMQTKSGTVECARFDAEPPGATEPVRGLPDVQAVAVGSKHACALGRDGRAYCWGANEWGQLGDGTRASREEAAPVVELEDLVAISVFDETSCGLTRSGAVHCWGSNHNGEAGAGVGPYTTIETPVEVAFPTEPR